MNSFTAIYVASGVSFLAEAMKSAESLKNSSPTANIILFTSESVHDQNLFDEVFAIDEPKYDYYDKIKCLSECRLESFVFLDTDTFICSDISPMFNLLTNFDIGAAHAPGRYPSLDLEKRSLPECFPDFNTGVILAKKTYRTEEFLKKWLDVYAEQYFRSKMHDQPAFSHVLYESNLRVATLPPEYNCRFIYPGKVCGQVRILHGRHSNLPGIEAAINKNESFQRVHYLNYNKKLKVRTHESAQDKKAARLLVRRLFSHVQKHGIKSAFKRVLSHVKKYFR